MMKNLHAVTLVVVALLSAALSDSSALSVHFTCGNKEDSCQLLVGQSFNLTIAQTSSSAINVTYNFRYSVGGDTCSEPRKNGYFLFLPIPPQTLKGNETKTLSVDTSLGNGTAGEVRIALNSSLLLAKAVVDVTITRSTGLMVFGQVIGWIYFLAWSLSFYPQIWINFRRKSVIGMNFDFVSLNLAGFACYTIYNLCLFFNSVVQAQYYEEHPLGVIQVEPNDVFFALHALAITMITLVQCLIYERAEQTVSKFCRALLFAMFLFVLVSLILAGTNAIDHNWLTFVELLSYVKLFITVIKYMPQAYMNYRRKSTDGWSIGNILLDVTGGSLSILQMFLKAYNYDDWKSIFGNVTKFGLGFFSVLFDVLFILQHYVFYRNNTPYGEVINDNRARST